MHDALVVVFDMTEANSLDGAMRWIKQVKDVKEMPLIMVGNKAELEEYRILSDQLFQEIHETTEIPCIATSAYTGQLVEDAFTLIIQLAYNRLVEDRSKGQGRFKLTQTQKKKRKSRCPCKS